MKKKLLSLVMAVAMVLSLAVPVLASDIPNNGYWGWSTDTSKQDKAEQTVKFPAKMFVPTIKLTLPTLSTTDPVVLNPYRIEYVATASAPNFLNSGGTSSGGEVSSANYNEQVICPVYAIKNQTNAKLNVKASATTEVSNNLTLASTHVALKETGNKALINFIVQKTSVNSGGIPNIEVNSGAMGFLNAYDTANNTVITLQATNPVQQVAVMKNASLESDGTATNYLLFQFDGELSRDPTTPWTASDKFTTTVVFTFTPVAIGDAVATYAKDDITKAAPTSDLTVNLPKVESNQINKNDGFATFATNPNSSAWDLSLHETAPAWEIIDAGSLGVTISGTGSAAKLSISKENLAKLPIDGQNHEYTCVLGFADKNGVPRTVEVTLTLKRLANS